MAPEGGVMSDSEKPIMGEPEMILRPFGIDEELQRAPVYTCPGPTDMSAPPCHDCRCRKREGDNDGGGCGCFTILLIICGVAVVT